MSLTVPLVTMYLRELGAIEKDRNLVLLRIVNNPYTEKSAQERLFNDLKTRDRPKPRKTIDYKAEKKKIEERVRGKRV